MSRHFANLSPSSAHELLVSSKEGASVTMPSKNSSEGIAGTANGASGMSWSSPKGLLPLTLHSSDFRSEWLPSSSPRDSPWYVHRRNPSGDSRALIACQSILLSTGLPSAELPCGTIRASSTPTSALVCRPISTVLQARIIQTLQPQRQLCISRVINASCQLGRRIFAGSHGLLTAIGVIPAMRSTVCRGSSTTKQTASRTISPTAALLGTSLRAAL